MLFFGAITPPICSNLVPLRARENKFSLYYIKMLLLFHVFIDFQLTSVHNTLRTYSIISIHRIFKTVPLSF